MASQGYRAMLTLPLSGEEMARSTSSKIPNTGSLILRASPMLELTSIQRFDENILYTSLTQNILGHFSVGPPKQH